ncbi:type II toxin-antitoxin system RelE/ParE family toxin [Candidatus Rariloculus sp.]|uniref:type II toxin-antitoxin system RelE/ParE family toxin n=1 Tax=Candidatus Rariloculus sp. TaxID=3101265 RepID=UPI003D0C3B56
MIFRSVRHRGLRRLLENDDPRYLRSDLVGRVRNVLTVLILAQHMEGFLRDALPGWRVHRLSGDRRNEWSVSISGNWRITFREADGYIDQLHLEDHH